MNSGSPPGLQFRQLNTWLLMALMAFLLFELLEPFLVPLTWAAVLAIFFYPMHRRVRRAIRGPSTAALVSTLMVTVVLIVPVGIALPYLIREAIHMFSELPTSEVMGQVQSWASRLPTQNPVFQTIGSLDQIVMDLAAGARTILAQQSARAAGNLAHSLFDLGITLFALYYFLRDGKALVDGASRLTFIHTDRWERILTEISQMVQVTVSTTFVVASLQGVAGTLAFLVLGISSPFVSGLAMAVSSVIPVVGALLIWGPVAAWFVIKGQTLKAIVIGVVGLVVVLGIDNLVRPALISGRSRLNPLLVLLSVLGGLSAFGGLGLVLGPVTTAIAVALLHAFVSEEQAVGSEPEQPLGGSVDPGPVEELALP